MVVGFRGIRVRLQARLERLNLRARLALLNLLQPIVVKLGSPEQRREFAAEWIAHKQKTVEEWKSVHRQALFASAGLALSQWAGVEETLVGITSLLLRTHEGNKVGIIMYSIINFNTQLSIVGELFSQEPLYIALKPKWNKISERLRALKDTRDRLAHHTIFYGESGAAVRAGWDDPSLRPARFDSRQKSQKYQPLDSLQIYKFMEDVDKVMDSLRELLNAMTALLTHETSQRKSSEPTSDQPHP
jgi:hypothetical protein